MVAVLLVLSDVIINGGFRKL
ncbi:hypothetical protein [Escherichia coli]|nr:hypothetical protein [Escherichia coli]